MNRLALVTILILITTFAFAGGKECAPGAARVFADDGNVTWANDISGERLKSLKKAYGKPFLYVERGSKSYLITDPGTLEDVRDVLSRQLALGQKQAALGSQQAALGTKQAALGMEQARLGMQQAREPENTSLGERLNELGRKQNALGEEQNRLGEQQNRLGEEQARLSDEMDRKVDALVDRAIRDRIAKEVPRA